MPLTVYVVVVVGVTLIDEVVADPGLQVQLVKPDCVRIVDVPEQIVYCDAVAITDADGLTLTVIVALPGHPFALVPLTVYVVLIVGETLIDDVVADPGLQVQLVKPLCESVVVTPEQIVLCDAVAVTEATGFTLTVIVALPGQPFALVPLTVYEVVVVGETFIEAVVAEPGLQVQLVKPV